MATKPTRFPNGLSNVNPESFWGSFGAMSPTKYHQYFNDFNAFAAGDWTITTVEAGGGSASEAVTDKLGGALLLTNDAADNDYDNLILAGEGFQFTAGKKLWFEAKLQVSDATESDVFVGLAIKTATDPVGTAPTDGAFFRKDDGDTDVDFVVTKDSTATTSTELATLADATDITLSFYYNGVDNIAVWVNGGLVDNVAVTNIPDDELIAPMMHIQNGAAAAKTMTVDYILAAQER
ncbi:hypothetical protein [Alcanivorax sp.]|uniref:hypothetical protein n=1 Tax=Alcanivorax sp. TaxID=1872427 RepID=UPI001988CF5E|nr:hypothetical protein [Alcanivorax sp.]MBD3643549.1 hypothetical protein [Alcanivorax sp.]